MAEPIASYPLDHLSLDIGGGETDGLVLRHRRGVAFCQVFARRGCIDKVAEALGIGASPGIATHGEEFTALPLAPRTWLLNAPSGRNGAFTRDIAERIAGIGYASEQSHGRTVIRVAGTDAKALLAKECRLDLEGRDTGPGWVAQTTLAEVAVTIHQLDDRPTYELMLYPGYAEHFWHWLQMVAADFDPHLQEDALP